MTDRDSSPGFRGADPAPDGFTVADDPEEGWHRFHPLSPLLRGGVSLVAVAAFLIGNQFDTLFGSESQLPEGDQLRWAALAVFGFLVAVLAAAWLTWRVSRFRIGETTLELRTGLLFRQHRQVRYDRIQAVDVNRPLLARLTGLAEVKVQAAGGADSDARLAYLADGRAREVRDTLMALAGRREEQAAPGEGAGGGDEALRQPVGAAIVKVPNARQLQAALFSGPALFMLLAVPGLVAGFLFDLPGLLPVLGPALLGVGGNHLGSLVKQLNFEVVRDRDGIRVRRGLTDLRTSSVPVHRIQVIAVRQPMFWRLFDWWRVEVNVAGVGHSQDDTESVALPVGTRAEALRVVEVLRPSAHLAALEAGLVGEGAAGFVVAPERAAWVSPLVRRRHGYAVTADALLVRGGRLRRWVNLVPHARIQSLALHQGPLQRSMGLASVHVLSTPGSADPWVRHLSVDAATGLLNDQVHRSARARILVR